MSEIGNTGFLELNELYENLKSADSTMERATTGNLPHTVGNVRSYLKDAIEKVNNQMRDRQKFEKFVLHVLEMRRFQVAFFGSPPGGETRQHNLQEAKKWEKQVDEFLKKYNSAQQELPL